MDDASATLIAAQLGAMDVKLDRVLEVTSQHAPRISALEAGHEDHEKRIRIIEEAGWSRKGLIGLAGASAALVAALGAIGSQFLPVG